MIYVLEWRTVSALKRGLFWCLFPKLWSNEGNKHLNNTRVSARKVHESTYIILFLTWHNRSTNDNENNDHQTSTLCLTCSVYNLMMMSQSNADDDTVTRQLWHNHVNCDIYFIRYWFLFMAICIAGHVKNCFTVNIMLATDICIKSAGKGAPLLTEIG